MRRFVDDGILIIGEAIGIKRSLQDVAIHGGYLEDTKQRAEVFVNGFPSKNLGAHIVESGRGCRADKALDPAVVYQGHQLLSDLDVGLSLQQNVEQYVGVEEHSHRYFSSR